MVAVIGDIHGCLNTLTELVKEIRLKYPGIEIFSVGDLIDRGNYGRQTVEYILSEGIKFTPGNHDYMFYYFMRYPASDMGSSWLFNGYESTMASYEGYENEIDEHLDIIFGAPLFYNLSDCFISHAGISQKYRRRISSETLNDDVKLEQIFRGGISDSDGILWTRGELLNIGKLQVVGHTRRAEVTYNETGNVLYIDTSAFAGNKLTAAVIEEGKPADIIAVPTFEEDIR